MNTNNDTNHNQSTNKKDKALAVLLCIGVFAGLVYLSHLSRNKAEEFSKEVEKRFNVSIPSEFSTKAAKVKWFCETYSLSPESCNDLSSIESRVITGDLWDSRGFDIKDFEHRMQEAKNDPACHYNEPEALENKIKKRRTSHIEIALLSKDDHSGYFINAGNVIYTALNPLCPH